MGWYFRRSVKFGPLRLNFSKSGIGYSVGVKGLRFGTGPRGRYVAGGRYGIYFRQFLKSRGSTTDSFCQSMTSTPGYCTHCGTEVHAGDYFCTQCGAMLEIDQGGQVFEPEHSIHRHPVFWVIMCILATIFLVVALSHKAPSP